MDAPVDQTSLLAKVLAGAEPPNIKAMRKANIAARRKAGLRPHAHTDLDNGPDPARFHANPEDYPYTDESEDQALAAAYHQLEQLKAAANLRRTRRMEATTMLAPPVVDLTADSDDDDDDGSDTDASVVDLVSDSDDGDDLPPPPPPLTLRRQKAVVPGAIASPPPTPEFMEPEPRTPKVGTKRSRSIVAKAQAKAKDGIQYPDQAETRDKPVPRSAWV